MRAFVCPVCREFDSVRCTSCQIDWRWMSLFFNRVNTATGKGLLYPSQIPPAVATKLGFVHPVIAEVV